MQKLLQRFALAAAIALPLAGPALADNTPAISTGPVDNMCSPATTLGSMRACLNDFFTSAQGVENHLFGEIGYAEDIFNHMHLPPQERDRVIANLARLHPHITATCENARTQTLNAENAWRIEAARAPAAAPVSGSLRAQVNAAIDATAICHTTYANTLNVLL
ncbi:MAG: hypothetical protein KJ667_02580, partial [Alphaproteobacteria bacterium]|nr:hypothetical protein [Alphaproteobacteria bacterium]